MKIYALLYKCIFKAKLQTSINKLCKDKLEIYILQLVAESRAKNWHMAPTLVNILIRTRIQRDAWIDRCNRGGVRKKCTSIKIG